MSDIHIKLANIAGKVGPLNKTERNQQQGFNFRSIKALTGSVRQLFADEGVSIAPRLINLETSEIESAKGSKGYRTVAHMSYTFTAGSDDSFIEVSMPGEAVDYGDKSTSKAVQMAYKYALTQVLIVGSGDADPDGHTQEIANRKEPNPDRRNREPRKDKTQPTPSTPVAGAALERWQQFVGESKARLLEALRDDKDQAKLRWDKLLLPLGKLEGPPSQSVQDMLGAELSLIIGEILTSYEAAEATLLDQIGVAE